MSSLIPLKQLANKERQMFNILLQSKRKLKFVLNQTIAITNSLALILI